MQKILGLIERVDWWKVLGLLLIVLPWIVLLLLFN